MEMVSGYVMAKHLFGRSAIVRDGQRLYYLKWQWTKGHDIVDDVIYISRDTYERIKKLLLPIRDVSVHDISQHSRGVEYRHETSSKNYMRIKRYLIKNKILKEEKQHGNRFATGSKTA